MKKIYKTGLGFIALGIVVFIWAMAMAEFDFAKLWSTDYVENEVVIERSFDRVEIDASHADVYLSPSEDARCTLIYDTGEDLDYDIEAHPGMDEQAGGTLRIAAKPAMERFVWFSFDTAAPRIELRLPEWEYEAFVVSAASGDIFAGGLLAQEWDLDASSGDLHLKDVCGQYLQAFSTSGEMELENVNIQQNAVLQTSSGDLHLGNISVEGLRIQSASGEVELRNSIAWGTIEIKTSSGDVQLAGADAAKLHIQTASGEVKGTLLSPKEFIADSASGDIVMEASTPGAGICTVKTASGDIELIAPAE